MDLSFCSANSFPIKLFKDTTWYDGRIKPTHLQFNPTNRCNLQCSFCSCSDRERSIEFALDDIKREFKTFSDLGGKSVTITGGGEPLLHPNIDEIIEYIDSLGIKMGLVTNGTLLWKPKSLSLLTWCRVSISYCNYLRPEWEEIINKNHTDWAFSCVMTKEIDIGKIQELIDFSDGNEHVTHVRLVSNILEPERIPKFKNDRKVIYQERTAFTKGTKLCWISLVKPYLNTDGHYYPCCGVQYARKNRPHKMIEEMSMGTDLRRIIDLQIPFDGSGCDKCYYENYNAMIDLFRKDYKHVEFV